MRQAIVFIQVMMTVFLISSIAFAGESSEPKAFKSRAAFIQALIDADFNQIFEFKFQNSKAVSVYIATYDEHQKKSFQRISYEELIKSRSRWIPVPALNYKMEKQPLFGKTQIMHAYKVGSSLICHDPSDSWALDATTFCISVPVNVDVVIKRMELRGVLNQ